MIKLNHDLVVSSVRFLLDDSDLGLVTGSFGSLLSGVKSSVVPQCGGCVCALATDSDGGFAQSKQVLAIAAEEKLPVQLLSSLKCTA